MRFADDIDLLGGSEEELQQLTERLKKTAVGYGMEISCDKNQNYRQQHQAKSIYQHKDEWQNAGRSGPVQIPRSNTNQRGNINEGSKETGANIFSHDKASNNMENKAISFPTKIDTYILQVLPLQWM